MGEIEKGASVCARKERRGPKEVLRSRGSWRWGEVAGMQLYPGSKLDKPG